jgi:hypothetical protein
MGIALCAKDRDVRSALSGIVSRSTDSKAGDGVLHGDDWHRQLMRQQLAALHVIVGHDGLALGTPRCPATLSKIGWEPQVEAWGEFSLRGMKGNFCSILRLV